LAEAFGFYASPMFIIEQTVTNPLPVRKIKAAESLFQIKFHSKMRALKTQILVKPVRVFAIGICC